ncbi:MAG: arsenic resistance N-acetyltransferase ArsN2 [Planctomycetota bacterium]
MQIRPAADSDFASIISLLCTAGLPVHDLSSGERYRFEVLLEASGQPAGACAVEPRGNYGLLRSLVVSRDFQGLGYGRKLVESVETSACGLGISELYLLTETAESFFHNLGYQPVDREAVPQEIRLTTEFSSICPDSAACLMKYLNRD